jgi:hypothetical protein
VELFSGVPLGLTCKHYTWLDRLARDKHSSLFVPLIN